MKDSGQPDITFSENPATAIFEREWRTYRKLVDHNYLFHREACQHLRRLIDREMPSRFRFLDIACGDAGATAIALDGTGVSHYCGIDISAVALSLAEDNLAGLRCRIDLRRGDFAQMIESWVQPADLVWIGLSLHHFRTPDKLSLMKDIRKITGSGGLLVVYENTSPDGEDREGWLERWDLQRERWTACRPEEWEAMTAHVHANDYPETVSGWHQLGREAGYEDVREEFVAPTNLFRMFRFQG